MSVSDININLFDLFKCLCLSKFQIFKSFFNVVNFNELGEFVF